VLAYVKAHGGGTIAVSSQSGAASAILQQDASIAGIGGFSGRESNVNVAWLAQEVSSGRIRWVLDQGASGSLGGGLRGDTRAGSKAAITAVAQACRKVTLPGGSEASATKGGSAGSSGRASAGSSGSASAGSSGSAAASGTLYDCQGRAASLALLGAQKSA
jgi:hypothetical protein